MAIETTIQELLNELRQRRWSDSAIGAELGVSSVTVWRWRNGKQGVVMPKLVWQALEALLMRP